VSHKQTIISPIQSTGKGNFPNPSKLLPAGAIPGIPIRPGAKIITGYRDKGLVKVGRNHYNLI